MDLLKILDTKPIPGIIDAKSLQISGNVSGNYWLPTTMNLYQKELTDQIVSLHYSDILRCFETNDYKEDVVLQSMETMCLNSQYVATHPFLLIDHYMPKSLITKDVPVHLAETSGKFTALRDLVNILQNYETNTAIVCRPGRTIDLLEALLFGSKVNIKRYDGSSIKVKQKPRSFSSTFHLFPSDGLDLEKYPIKAIEQFNMLIALDPSVDENNPAIQIILKHKRNITGSDTKAPIVRMVSINSIDHCDLYFSKQFEKESKEKLECITAAVVVLRDRVGILPPDLRPIYSQRLRYLVDWLEDSSLAWPLPDVYAIKRYTSMDVERSLLIEVNYSQTEDSLEAAFSNNKKRRRIVDDRENMKGEGIFSFYDIKRVQNDYSSNPLKQNMTQLTGITTANKIKGCDYHLSSGILTHKLIQSMDQVYIDIKRQNQELQDFSKMEPVQEGHAELLIKEKKEVHEKKKRAIEKISENLTKAEKLDSENKKLHKSIEILEGHIVKDLKSLGEMADDHAILKVLFIKSRELKEDVAKEQRIMHSKFSEKEYMQEEINRAETAIQDSKNEIEKAALETSELHKKLEEDFTFNRSKKSDIILIIDELKELIHKETETYSFLEKKLSKTLEKLNNLPTSRIRASNGHANGSSARKQKSRM